MRLRWILALVTVALAATAASASGAVAVRSAAVVRSTVSDNASPTGVLPAGWASGPSAGDPRGQVAVDGVCGSNSVLLFSARGSGDRYGAGLAKNKVGAWTQGAGLAAIREGWSVRDLQAIYPAPPVPSFGKLAKAAAVGELVGGASGVAEAAALIAKQFRDAASGSWMAVRAELESAYARCPSRKILLAGYSQGAILLRYLVPSLDPTILKQIVSVDLFADPTEQRAVDGKLQHPSSLDGRLTAKGIDTLSGLLVHAGAFHQTPYPSSIQHRIYQYCVDGDLVCDASLVNLEPLHSIREGKIHASYAFEFTGLAAGKRLGAFVAPASPPTGIDQLTGSWIGPVHQPGAAQTDFNVQLDFTTPVASTVATMSLPGICTGSLRYRDSIGTTFRFDSTITSGNCLPGIITLTPAVDGTLQYEWDGAYSDGTPAHSQGILGRISS